MGSVRIAPWRGDGHVALLAPVIDHGGPSTADVARCIGSLRDRGVEVALTAALGPGDQRPFLDLGFEVHERLHLLVHDLRSLPERPPAPVRRARRSDHAAVLAVDHAAFPPFWQIDETGLREALTATPSSRFRVVVGASREVAGYAVWGRAGPRGYLQRLGVAPDQEGAGRGRALIADGLAWMRRRRGVNRVFVNTQEANERALRLYEHVGFRRQRDGLAVLRLHLADS